MATALAARCPVGRSGGHASCRWTESRVRARCAVAAASTRHGTRVDAASRPWCVGADRPRADVWGSTRRICRDRPHAVASRHGCRVTSPVRVAGAPRTFPRVRQARDVVQARSVSRCREPLVEGAAIGSASTSVADRHVRRSIMPYQGWTATRQQGHPVKARGAPCDDQPACTPGRTDGCTAGGAGGCAASRLRRRPPGEIRCVVVWCGVCDAAADAS